MGCHFWWISEIFWIFGNCGTHWKALFIVHRLKRLLADFWPSWHSKNTGVCGKCMCRLILHLPLCSMIHRSHYCWLLCFLTPFRVFTQTWSNLWFFCASTPPLADCYIWIPSLNPSPPSPTNPLTQCPTIKLKRSKKRRTRDMSKVKLKAWNLDHVFNKANFMSFHQQCDCSLQIMILNWI